MDSFIHTIAECAKNPSYANSDSGRNAIIDGVKQVVGTDVNNNDLNRSNINVNVVVPSLKSNDIQSQAQAQAQYQKQSCGGPVVIEKPVYKKVPKYEKRIEQREVIVQKGYKKVLCGYEKVCIDNCNKDCCVDKCDKKKYVCKNKCVKVCKCKKIKRCKPKKCESTSSYCSSSSSCTSQCDSSSSDYCSSSSSSVVCKKKNKCDKVEKIVECKPYLHCEEKVRRIPDFETKKKYVVPDCNRNDIKYVKEAPYKNDLKCKW